MVWPQLSSSYSELLSGYPSSDPQQPNQYSVMSSPGFVPLGELDMESTLARHRESVSSSSGSSVCEPLSPIARHSSISQESTGGNAETDADDAPWNLVAYHIPWGSCYEGYESGTLPGPDGTCIFLRSPTPLKRQRTTQACEKCRERKAKCSGTRPSCTRCTSRGLNCTYVGTDSQQPPTRSTSRRLSHSKSGELSRGSTNRNRLRHKSSLVIDVEGKRREITVDTSSESHNTSHPEAVWEERCSDQKLDIFETHSSVSIPPREGLDVSVLESTSPAFSASPLQYSPSQALSDLQSYEASFSQSPPTLLYANPLSGLDGYRFPNEALDDVKGSLTSHPQGQVQDVSQEMYMLTSPPPGTVGGFSSSLTLDGKQPDFPWNNVNVNFRSANDESFAHLNSNLTSNPHYQEGMSMHFDSDTFASTSYLI